MEACNLPASIRRASSLMNGGVQSGNRAAAALVKTLALRK
jgi:hypothetical protein